MAVYREGYSILEKIQKALVQVFSDACDVGAPVQKDSQLWKDINQLFEWYADKRTKRNETITSYSFEFTLMDEWAVSDERKTVKEATEVYKLTYTKLEQYQKKPYLNPQFKGMHGFVEVDKIS
jgi:hypothetical protein